MDWIKQIMEYKKGNWESPGSLGQKIKKIRMLRRYTQKELGVMCGFSLSSADVRIAQYEKNKKIPREKILKAMCNALGVGEGALVHADMLSYQEMFYALFDMEDFTAIVSSMIFLKNGIRCIKNIQDQEEMMKKKNIHSAVMNIQMRSQWYRSMNY